MSFPHFHTVEQPRPHQYNFQKSPLPFPPLMSAAVFPGRNGPPLGDTLAKFAFKPTESPHFSDLINPNAGYNLNRGDTPSNQLKWQHFNGPQPWFSPPPCSQPADLHPARSTCRTPNGPNTPIDCSSLFRKEYVVHNLDSYSRMQRRELKRRMISDLIRVQQVVQQIETGEFPCRKALELPPPPAFTPPIQAEKRPPMNNLNENGAPNGSNEPGTLKKLSRTNGGRDLASCRGPKPRAVQRKGSKMSDQAMMKRCKQILEKLMRRKHAWIFNKPVDAEGLKLHNYSLIIKHPMDLGTVKSKLLGNEYKTPQEFAADVRLTFNNALVYNQKGEEVHSLAELFLECFEGMIKTVVTQHPQDQIPINPSLPVQESKSFPQPVVSPWPGKSAMLVVMDSNERQMTFKEKMALGMSLQNLDQDKIELVLQTIMKRYPSLPVESGEIDLDIEALDSETLWELDRFVKSLKNDLNDAKMQSISKVPKDFPIPQHKGDDAEEEEDIDIGEEAPNSGIPTIEIDKDDVSGTSSSTTSNSSSSSSSSGNSSGNDSEARAD
ncbi:hypothetical protein DM860_014534 [Cuscuta australis]|uniref:Bromo domain-containing protein n=1 Tax=Cuscuta australis TaxID=267555 RepID=A0A328DY09_9ASTE|nr:hypothetical protein DM860_014534 [Cuscuta australis]